MGLFCYIQKDSIISEKNLPTTEIIEPFSKGFLLFLCLKIKEFSKHCISFVLQRLQKYVERVSFVCYTKQN